MGGGIAQVAAQAGLDVLFADQTKDLAEKGKSKIAEQLKKQQCKMSSHSPWKALALRRSLLSRKFVESTQALA